jgi:hypothetical protein
MFKDQSDSVETLHISANEAFGRFKGKQLDTENVDFSDRIRKSKKKGSETSFRFYSICKIDYIFTFEQP